MPGTRTWCLLTMFLAVSATATTASEVAGMERRPGALQARAGETFGPGPAGRRAATLLRERVPEARVQWHPWLGAPRWVADRGRFLSGEGGKGGAVTPGFRGRHREEDPHGSIKAFVDEYRDLFGHDSGELAEARLRRDYVAGAGGLRTTVWQQDHAGLEIFEAVFQSHTTARGELVNIASTFVPHLSQVVSNLGDPQRMVRLSAEAGLAAALSAASFPSGQGGDGVVRRGPEGMERQQFLQAPFLKGEARLRLVWLPLDKETLRLTWEVIFTPRGSGQMLLSLVDAESGEVWLWRSLTRDLSQASFRVFTGDSPTPFSPGYTSPQQSEQPVEVPRALVTWSALDVSASPEGWIPDGINQTFGNNVDAHTDLDDDDQADLPRPQGSPTRVFDFALDLGQAPEGSSYRKAAVVNLFYWCNWAHDRLYQLGFTEAAGNFQEDNFGKGGVDGDRVLADAQDGGGLNNANFATPPDGLSPRMQMYLWNHATPNRDGDFDAEVILHEYVHGLTDRLVGGGVGLSDLQSRGLGEGWSDFYALALLSQPGDAPAGAYAMGAYVLKGLYAKAGANYYYGLRRYPYSTDLSKNPLTFRDIDPALADPTPGVPFAFFSSASAGEVHNVGEVWCAMLWDARAKLVAKLGHAAGNELMLQLVTDGLKLAPANPTFTEARDAILQAELVLTGGTHRGELWAAFARRGLGVEAEAPPSDDTTGVVEDYAGPDTLRVSPMTQVVVTGPFGGPFPWSNQTYTLSNTMASALAWSAQGALPLQWNTTGGVLPAHGVAQVTVSLNLPAAEILPEGLHERLIVFSNHVTHVQHVRPFRFEVSPALTLKKDLPGMVTRLEGPEGGPFILDSLFPLVLQNHSGQAMSWAAAVPPLLTAIPSSGLLPGQSEVEIVLGGSLEAVGLPLGNYTNQVFLTNLVTGSILSRMVVLQVRNDAYLTEEFEPPNRPLDLIGKSITFLPDGSEEGYGVCVSEVTTFPTDPAGGTDVSHNGYWFEEETEVLLAGGKTVSLFGHATNRVWIERDGGVSLSGVVDSQPNHFKRLGVSGLLGRHSDSDSIKQGARISWKQLADRFSVTWEGVVPWLSGPGDPTNTFQVELFFSGPIRITVLGGNESSRLTTGLSRGTSLPADFTSTDFSARPDCAEVWPALHLALPKSFTEGEGQRTGVGRVWRDAPGDSAQSVLVVSGDPSEITVSPFVVIPAGATSAVFTVTVEDDLILDGSKPAVITATAPFHVPAKHVVMVHDNETTTLHLQTPLFCTEGLLQSAHVWTEAPVEANVAVALASTNGLSILPFGFTYLLAGTTGAVFHFIPTDDQAINGTRLTDLSASVVNWTSATNGMLITDDESNQLTVVGPLFLGESGSGILSNIAEVRISGTLSTNLTVTLNTTGGGFFEYLAFGPVTIPAGKTNAPFHVLVTDDTETEPLESFQVVASAPGFENGVWNPYVIDNDQVPEPRQPFPPHLAEEVPLAVTLAWERTEGELVRNGDFEEPGLAGWSRTDQGAGAWVSAEAAYDPPGPAEAKGPLAGLRAARSMQYGNGRHELWQEIRVPAGLKSAMLSWSHRWVNHAAGWQSSQQFRVELRDQDNAQLQRLFVTGRGHALDQDWTSQHVDLTPWMGRSLRLVFVEEDQLGALDVMLDNISLVAEPAAATTWLVHFGTDGELGEDEYLGATTNAWWPVSRLVAGTTYFWQITSVREGATHTGPRWQFSTTATGNLPPSVTLRTPVDQAMLPYTEPVTVALDSVMDEDREVQVELWADGRMLRPDRVDPVSATWTPAWPGEHLVWAVAQDSEGARATSAVHRVSVLPADGLVWTLLPFGSEWRYHDGGADLGTSWHQPRFNADAWPLGPAQLGYGDGDEATPIGFGEDPKAKHVTSYFRRGFDAIPGARSLHVRALRDDGLALYLNGREIVRDNLVPGAAAVTYATMELGGAEESVWLARELDPALVGLRGANLVAAEVHQATADSVDLSFDLELTAVINPPPSVALVFPQQGELFGEPQQIDLVASATDPYGSVMEVDFLVDGVSVGSAVKEPYAVTWETPSPGPHALVAVAKDDLGGIQQSAVIMIYVAGPAPVLRTHLEADQMEFTWPEASGGYRLETTTNLVEPVQWWPVDGEPTLQDGQYRFILPLNPEEPHRFFRLTAP